MTSAINYSGINENFPAAGQDNDTQVFRDNFDSIKTGMRIAQEEITDLQDNAARTDLDNIFNYKELSEAVFRDTYYKLADLGGIPSATHTIEYKEGNYQIIRFGADIVSLDFLGFPDGSSEPPGYGKVRLELYTTTSSTIVNFISTAGTVFKKNSTFPATLILSSVESAGGVGDPIIIDVWKSKSDRMFLYYVDQFTS
jgi:hypothetical protein